MYDQKPVKKQIAVSNHLGIREYARLLSASSAIPPADSSASRLLQLYQVRESSQRAGHEPEQASPNKCNRHAHEAASVWRDGAWGRQAATGGAIGSCCDGGECLHRRNRGSSLSRRDGQPPLALVSRRVTGPKYACGYTKAGGASFRQHKAERRAFRYKLLFPVTLYGRERSERFFLRARDLSKREAG